MNKDSSDYHVFKLNLFCYVSAELGKTVQLGRFTIYFLYVRVFKSKHLACKICVDTLSETESIKFVKINDVVQGS